MKTRDAALLVGAVALASRLPWLCPVEQDLDGSRFVRALMRFDLVQGHPHPPGYPLLVLLGRVAMRAVGAPSLALSLVSAVAFAVTASSAFTVTWRATRARPTAYLAALTFALGTCATVQSTRPLSDMLGCALAWSTLRLAESPSRNGFHGALIGMLAAARPSALPITLVGALRRSRGNLRSALTLAGTGALTALILYAPAVWSVGLTRFASLVTEHAEGHFTRFGGSVVTRPDLVERARAFAFGVHAHLLGGWWTDRAPWLLPATVATWALVLVGAARARAVTLLRGPLASCAVYVAWVFFGQNVVWQPRHLLPLAPAVAILAALGFEALRARARWVAVALAVLALAPAAVESSRLLRTQSRVRPPTLRIVDEIERRCDPARTLVATGQLATWIRFRASGHRVVEVRDIDEALSLARRNGVGLCVTSEVAGVEARGLRRVARVEGDRYVTSTLYDLALWMTP